MSGAGRRETSFERDLIATIALAGYSAAVAAGFARVFSGWAFLADLLVLVVLGHGLSFALRRARVSGWIAVPTVSIALVWALLALHYGDTMTLLLPTAETWDLIELEISVVRDQFATAVAPVIYGAGWAPLAGFALIIAIVMADAFAFRAEARGEALVPGGVLFVFIAALGSPRLRIVVTALLVATGVLAVVALRALHDRSRRVELVTARAPVSLVGLTAVATASCVALLAGVVGPRVPGAGSEPLYDTKGRGGGVTEVISPLVTIRSRLTNRSNNVLFRVNADAPAYWRATTLPEFDGSNFRLPTRPLRRVTGALADPGADADRNRQRIQIVALGGQLVPAAADPFQADGFSDGQRLDLRFNAETNTLVTPGEISPGDLFDVVSASPALNGDQLRAATTTGDLDPIFTDLPDDLPQIVGELAREVTAGAATPYDRAIALQDWMRSFDYSLEVQSGHGSNAIESFLNDRVGYCEQFSATFAAMARTLGMPSRVAVGFTPGLPNEDGWYVVLGKNAHAWPELWFEGIGWVAFEPTPGRGAPGAEGYTGVPFDQDTTGPTGGGGGEAGGGGGATETIPVPTTPSTISPPEVTSPSGTPNFDDLLPDDLADLNEGGAALPGDGGAGPAETSSIPWTPILVTSGVVGLLAAPWLLRRWRRHSLKAQPPEQRVWAAWSRALAAAERGGVVGSPAMTANEWAVATATALPVAARPMGSLAEVVDRVTFAPPGAVDLDRHGSFGSTVSQDCELWSAQVRRIAGDNVPPWRRSLDYFIDWT